MGTQDDIIIETGNSIERIFDIQIQEKADLNKLKERLTEELVYMLLHKMEALLQVLYRIDVNEKKVKACFDESQPDRIAPRLADLIIEREIQKSLTRKEYRERDNNSLKNEKE